MKGKYQKFEIKMEMENRGYRLWKNGVDEVVCILETYKEKRSIFFSVCNMLPSEVLKRDCGKEYRILLLGTVHGEVIHRDFGTFRVNQSGEGSFFQKFTGPELTCYTHCLLVASALDTGIPEILYQGETPFFVEGKCSERESLWSCCEEENQIFPFSDDADETGANWYRIPVHKDLPDFLEPCKDAIEAYRHFIVGKKEEKIFVGIPGRFMRREQPCRDENLFQLWQPLRGGENFFDRRETMTKEQTEEIFGYWIAELDFERKTFRPA